MTNTEIDAILDACAKLTAHQIDAVIQGIGILRSNTEPPVPASPDDLVPVTDAPALVGGVRADGRFEISIRSPAFGWQKFTLSDHNTIAIGEHFILTKPFWKKTQHLTVHKADGTLM